MLIKIALTLLVSWVVGLGDRYPHQAVQVVLLIGLMLLFLGLPEAQDAQRASHSDAAKKS
jgi:hypothetical protein